MIKNILTIFSACIVLTSCGPSKQEIEAKQKQLSDSVASATREQIAKEVERKDSILTSEQATQDSTIAAQQTAAVNESSTKEQLIQLKSDLAAAQSKLDNVQEFKVLRTSDEKAAQVRAATEEVETIKVRISEVENQLH